MSYELKDWSDATWWLDDHKVGLDWNYKDNKLDISFIDGFDKKDEAIYVIKRFYKDLKRFILETDAIRKKKDEAHRFDD